MARISKAQRAANLQEWHTSGELSGRFSRTFRFAALTEEQYRYAFAAIIEAVEQLPPADAEARTAFLAGPMLGGQVERVAHPMGGWTVKLLPNATPS